MRRAWLIAGLLVGAGAAHAQDATFSDPRRFLAQDGGSIYRDVCQGCHMPDGRGAEGAGRYPALAGDARLDPPAFPIVLVLRGAGAMPGFGQAMTDAQIAAVVTYIRTHFGNRQADPVSPDAVRAAR